MSSSSVSAAHSNKGAKDKEFGVVDEKKVFAAFCQGALTAHRRFQSVRGHRPPHSLLLALRLISCLCSFGADLVEDDSASLIRSCPSSWLVPSCTPSVALTLDIYA